MKKKNFTFFVLLFIFFLTLIFTYSKNEHQVSGQKELRRSLPENANLFLHIPGESYIYFSGAITEEISKLFVDTLKENNKIHSLYINSPGGEISSAIDIARLIRAHSIKVIVVGLCHSACADYIFAGAKHKSVLPGGIVAIHEPVNSILINGNRQNFLFMDFEKQYISKNDARKEFDVLLEKKRAFLKEINVSEILHDSYRVYLRNRNSSQAKRKFNCPILDGWALSEKQMKLMGVEGFGDFWYPKNSVEQTKTLENLKIASGSFFFGGSKNMESMCQNKEMKFIDDLTLRISQFFEI